MLNERADYKICVEYNPGFVKKNKTKKEGRKGKREDEKREKGERVSVCCGRSLSMWGACT